MVDRIGKIQADFLSQKDGLERKKFGQYFTEPVLSDYMSNLIDLRKLDGKDHIKILDCGAGHGILTISLAIKLLNEGFKKVSATLYEIDPSFIPGLKENLNKTKDRFLQAEGKFEFLIVEQDFITHRADKNVDFKFDLSIINPPYFKYNSDSPYKNATSDLFKGDPNIYASFIAVMINSLSQKGQGVVISPRSFVNGLYFKGFRNFFLSNTNLQKIHIFKKRNDVFKEAEILQENIIFKFTKEKKQSDEISVLSSHGKFDLDKTKEQRYSSKILIDEQKGNLFIRIPETNSGYQILLKAENLPITFEAGGYKISTGRVVDFRTREFITLSSVSNGNTVPLFKAHNIKNNNITWSGELSKDRVFKLINNYEKHLNTNQKYILVKRFSSKDEKRRLVSGVYNPVPNNEYIGIDNKLNYITKEDYFKEYEAEGLSTFLNSTFMDDYYRCISGNTQVNATDIRIMKILDPATLIEIGKEISSEVTIDQYTIDSIVEHYLDLLWRIEN